MRSENTNAGDVFGSLVERPTCRRQEFVRLMLGSGCAFSGGFLAVALVEAIDASGGIDQLLLAGKERVASGTNFNVQVTFFGGASLERLAARAGDGNINVFWVYSWFHMLTLSRRPRAAISNEI